MLPEADLVPEYTPVQVKLNANDKLKDTVWSLFALVTCLVPLAIVYVPVKPLIS